MVPPTRICFDRVIPPKYQPARAMAQKSALSAFSLAVRADTHNPSVARTHAAKAASSNQDPLQTISANSPIHIARMALISLKKWDNLHTLRCRFLDGDDVQKGKVRDNAQKWCDYANVTIAFVDDPDAEVRISFQADSGSWSAVGTDCLVASYFPPYQPTMNFGWLKDDTDDTEYGRVVVHEFGHALGCIHEHQQPNENLQWNKDAVYSTFSGPPNYWTKDDIDSNILKKYSPQGMSATRFDEKSIMLYQFDGSLFADGIGTPLNVVLSDEDKQMISTMYPKT